MFGPCREFAINLTLFGVQCFGADNFNPTFSKRTPEIQYAIIPEVLETKLFKYISPLMYLS